MKHGGRNRKVKAERNAQTRELRKGWKKLRRGVELENPLKSGLLVFMFFLFGLLVTGRTFTPYVSHINHVTWLNEQTLHEFYLQQIPAPCVSLPFSTHTHTVQRTQCSVSAYTLVLQLGFYSCMLHLNQVFKTAKTQLAHDQYI